MSCLNQEGPLEKGPFQSCPRMSHQPKEPFCPQRMGRTGQTFRGVSRVSGAEAKGLTQVIATGWMDLDRCLWSN